MIDWCRIRDEQGAVSKFFVQHRLDHAPWLVEKLSPTQTTLSFCAKPAIFTALEAPAFPRA
jgi:hypothetical protein